MRLVPTWMALAALPAGCSPEDGKPSEGDGDTDVDADADADTDIGSILPDDRRVEWSPGIPGGIPDREEICAIVTDPPYDAFGDGTHDDSSAIQRAIDDCPEGQVVHVPAGTYRLASRLHVTKGIVLRGDGPGVTRLEGDGVSSWAIVQIGEEWDYDGQPESALTAGYSKGSTRLEAEAAAGFSAGDLVIVDQVNDGELVRVTGSESDCVWGSREEGNRLLAQIVEVTAVDAAAGTLDIDPPLAWEYSAELSPEVLLVNPNLTRYAGIEDLTVADRSYRGDNNSNVRFHACAYCWAKNIESELVSGRHIDLNRTFRNEIRDSLVHHAHCYLPGANAYGIAVQNQTSDALIENNVVYYLNVGIVMGSSGPGNVIAYNYGDVMWESNYPDTSWVMADFSANHCAHPFLNLWEGNVGSQISGDDIHGGSSHQTFLRNTMDHEHEGIPADGNVMSVVLAAHNRSMSFFGNVLGQPGDEGQYDADQNCDEGLAIWKLGWPSDCSAHDGEIDADVAGTLLRHGNFDYVTEETAWDPGIPGETLPDSYYLTEKPEFFGALAWPPIGPDRDPVVGPIPAQERFASLPHEERGGDDCSD